MASDTIQAVLDFWFVELSSQDWFRSDQALDDAIRVRFSEHHRAAAAAETYAWRKTIHGRLAEIIVLDQFSRNIYRHSATAFAYDGQALTLAQEAINDASIRSLTVTERAFVYMPFMHSESTAIHEVALTLFTEPGMEHNLDFEQAHKRIIDRFGRYPHRNAILGRESTAEEIAFLEEDGSSF